MTMLMTMMLLLAGAGASAPAAAADAPEAATGKRDRMICKRFLETGSLVKGYRECKTKFEWEREREARRQFNVSDSCGIRGAPGDFPGKSC